MAIYLESRRPMKRKIMSPNELIKSSTILKIILIIYVCLLIFQWLESYEGTEK
jgi:hypothetical protein